jgi:hypothetical protein
VLCDVLEDISSGILRVVVPCGYGRVVVTPETLDTPETFFLGRYKKQRQNLSCTFGASISFRSLKTPRQSTARRGPGHRTTRSKAQRSCARCVEKSREPRIFGTGA